MLVTTYGQLKGGKKINYLDYSKEVRIGLSFVCLTATDKECKKLYNKGYSVEDAISYLTMKK